MSGCTRQSSKESQSADNTQSGNANPTSSTDPSNAPASSTLKKPTEGKETEPVSDHQRMVKALQKIHRENQNNPYFEGALAQAQKRYAISKQARNPFEAMPALYDVGREFIQKGDPEKALQSLNELRSIMDYVKERKPDAVNRKMEISTDLARAIAGIRKGENENCVNCLGGDGCLFPIRPGGVHRRKEGSQTALKYLDLVLERDPENFTAIWLLNIAHMTLGTHPEGVPEEYRLPEEKLKSEIDFPRFHNISTALKIDTLSHAGGVVVDDFDGDLDFDLFVSTWATDGQCRYFRNDGDKGFVDMTEETGLTGIVGGLNTRQFDFDNDGDPDVLILRGAWLGPYGRHPNSLLRNDGGTKFVEVAFETGIAGDDHPTQAADVADFDLDGDLDLYVGNEAEPNQLFRNDNGQFTEIAQSTGVADGGFSKGVAWGDVDNDGDPDLYVSNMSEKNRLYENLGNGEFKSWNNPIIEDPRQSFSCWFFDYNNDGNLDLFVAAYDEGVDQIAADYMGSKIATSEHDRLYRGDGKGGFEDVSETVGLGKISHTMGSNYGDLNNDGLLDFYLATGSPAIESLQPNLMYLNQEAKKFVDVSIAGGFSHLQKGHAISFADFDHDGDQDVFAELGGAYQGDAFQNALFQNPGFDGAWVKLSLVGTQANRTAVGARVEVVTDGPSGQSHFHRVVHTGSSFGSNPLRLHIGLADADEIKEIRVRWPGSTEPEVFEDILPGEHYRLKEGSEKAIQIQLPPIKWKIDTLASHGAKASN